MQQPLSNAAVLKPQAERFGGGNITPEPTPTPVAVPGSGVPATPMPKPAPTLIGGDIPMPKPNTQKDPAMGERSAGPIETPVPKQPVTGGETPMPKQPGLIGGDIPVPKPTVTTGPGTAPSAPGVTPGGASYAGSGGSIDWQSAIGATDRNAVTRTVQDNELTSKQLTRLIDENGRYIQQARLGAREGAAARGMLTSSFAAGAAERAAIDAAAPIAQSDAGTYASTASENMRAQNEDQMADQLGSRSLLSQSEGQKFQGSENAANRSFQASESAANRAFQSAESGIERDWRSTEAGRDRSQQFLMQERGFSFQDAQAAVERGWRSTEAEAERQFTGQRDEAQRLQGRISEYNNLLVNREAQLSQQLSSIFSNTNLTPAQQQAAADNARAIFSSTSASFNAAFSAGVPQIFFSPYAMQPGQQPTTPVAPPQTGIPAGGTPIPGTNTYRDSNGAIRTIANAVGSGG